MLRFLQTLLRTFIKIIVLVILASIFYSSYQQIQIKFPNAVHHRQRITALKADGTNNDASLKIQTDNDENLIWFMHVTDLHVSGFEDQKRHEMFRSFITEAVFHVKPKVVLVTGDLTDAKTYDGYGSQQNLWEWQTYKRIIDETGVKNITTWLDIRGNHDVFNVMDMHDEENYYPKFSVQGSEDWNQLTYRHRVEYGKKNSISFIGIDACPVPGPRRPFNFFGVVNKTMEENILRLAEQARKDSNITIFFGHYPTSSVSSETIEFENLMESGLAYFCGHFHNFGGLVPAFFALHPTGMLELELGDWKVSRLFRVAAIDNNMISFVDQKFGDWPVILVTLPKYKNIMTPSHEPVENIAHASHIRVLVFSTSDIAQVSIELPDGLSFREMHNVKGSPIYVYPWDAREYRKGKHDLRVYAKDAAGNSKMIKHSFQLDTESKNIVLSVLGRLFLMIDLFILVQIAFFLSNVAAVLPIWLFKEDR